MQEAKLIGVKFRMSDNLGFKFWYTVKNKTRNEVGITIDAWLRDKVVVVINNGNIIIAFKLMFVTINIVSVYAPQVGLKETKSSILVRF